MADGKRQRVDAPSEWCSPVVAMAAPASTAIPKWTFTPAPASQSTPTPSSSFFPAFTMPPLRSNSPPRFFFPEPDDVVEQQQQEQQQQKQLLLAGEDAARPDKVLKFRDPKHPLAGLMKEEGGVFAWMNQNKKSDSSRA